MSMLSALWTLPGGQVEPFLWVADDAGKKPSVFWSEGSSSASQLPCAQAWGALS